MLCARDRRHRSVRERHHALDAGERAPSGEHLIPLMACSDAVFAAVLKVTGRERSSRGRQVAEVRRLLGEAVLALDEIDR